MKEGIHRTVDGHYEMPLPLADPEKIMPNNRNIALRRLKQLSSHFKRNTAYKVDYKKFMQNIISAGYAERVPKDELQNNRVWYIPHHGVYHPRKPNKIRVVFDCSAKCYGESLNNNLLSGPDLTNNLVGVLLRFRQEPVAFICDIEQMFFQFYVNKEHRDMLRFMWWEKEDLEGEPVEFRMKVHLFGAASSPACANYGLHQAADDSEEKCGMEAAEFVRQDFYVDDGLKSTESIDVAVKLIKESQEICRNAGLRLHKFASNKREILSEIAEEDRAKELQDLDIICDKLPVERVLGIQWCIESDIFNFRMTLQDKPLTRRGILSTISSIYDPLGFLAPVLLIGKQILQQLCRDSTSWDSEIPDELRIKWEKWRNELSCLEIFEIPRCTKPEDFGKVNTVQIHHFSDASTIGYGQCSYLRLVGEKRVHCSLIMGKGRVAPLRPITVPRLELTAALLSVKVSNQLKRELNCKEVSEVFWTDSKIVLGYLSNDTRRFHVFVANKVQAIRDHTDPVQWKYVSSRNNPADEASRGIPAREFVSRSKWIKGPEFLWEEDIPEDTLKQEELKLNPRDPEVKKVKVHATHSSKTETCLLLERIEHLSDWSKTKRAVAVCIRLKSKLKAGTASKSIPVTHPYEPCIVEDLLEAETLIVKLVQETAFKNEIAALNSLRNYSNKGTMSVRKRTLVKTSTLCKLDPFLDSSGVLRVGGRLRLSEEPIALKHPAILPKKHHITNLIIRYFHEKEQHQGRGITSNAIRGSGFWIVGGRSAIAQAIFKCVKCRRFRSAVQEQKMADLPSERLEPAPPFTNCGVDYFGPWIIKDGRKLVKRYGVLFTCLASRAVHIETATSLTTDSFINALRRFLSIRGPIRQLRCDQGTNFVGATRELREALNELSNKNVKQFLLSQNCDYFEFKMNPPGASHMGGVWERQIRTIRNALASLLNQTGEQLDDEMLRTLMCEAMAIVNSRPLTTDNLSDAQYPEPLTPNHLLTMKSCVILPPPGEFVREDLYLRKRWRRVQFLANDFWSR